MAKSTFKPFTLEHAEKDQWVRFEPTDDPDFIHVRFQGACGQVMNNLLSLDEVKEQVARLYSLGYADVQEPEGAEPMRFLHNLGEK